MNNDQVEAMALAFELIGQLAKDCCFGSQYEARAFAAKLQEAAKEIRKGALT